MSAIDASLSSARFASAIERTCTTCASPPRAARMSASANCGHAVRIFGLLGATAGNLQTARQAPDVSNAAEEAFQVARVHRLHQVDLEAGLARLVAVLREGGARQRDEADGGVLGLQPRRK